MFQLYSEYIESEIKDKCKMGIVGGIVYGVK